MEDFNLKNLVFVLSVTNFLLAFVLPTLRSLKKTGVFPVSFNKSDTIQLFIGNVYFISLLFIFVSSISYSFIYKIYYLLVPISFLENDIFKIIGIISNQLLIIWIIIGQAQMEKSWRIGIFDDEKNLLITDGLFSFSRHPISIGLIFLMFTTFICMPNALTLVVFIISFVLVNIEVALEEIELKSKHGQKYIEYSKKTPKWI